MTKTIYGAGSLLAAQDAKVFLRRHGNSLSEVLHTIGGDRGLDIYCETDRLLDDMSPDPACVGRALREMRDVLAEVGAPDDRYAESLRWHGARLTDLAARLPR